MPGKGALDSRKVGVLTWETPERLRPMHDYVLIRLIEPPSESAGGIVIPPFSRDRGNAWEAEVIAVGPGLRSDKTGERLPMALRPGMRVLVPRDPGWELGEYRMLGEGAVLAVTHDAFGEQLEVLKSRYAEERAKRGIGVTEP